MSACPVAGSNGTDSWSRTIRHRPPPLNQWPLGPIGHRPLGPGDRRDPPMTEVEQVLGGDAAAAVIRRPDGDDVRARLVQRVEDDERDAPRRQHGAGVVGREHEDHAPRASLDEIGDPGRTRRPAAPRLGEDEVQALDLRDPLHTSDDLQGPEPVELGEHEVEFPGVRART